MKYLANSPVKTQSLSKLKTKQNNQTKQKKVFP